MTVVERMKEVLESTADYSDATAAKAAAAILAAAAADARTPEEEYDLILDAGSALNDMQMAADNMAMLTRPTYSEVVELLVEIGARERECQDAAEKMEKTRDSTLQGLARRDLKALTAPLDPLYTALDAFRDQHEHYKKLTGFYEAIYQPLRARSDALEKTLPE